MLSGYSVFDDACIVRIHQDARNRVTRAEIVHPSLGDTREIGPMEAYQLAMSDNAYFLTPQGESFFELSHQNAYDDRPEVLGTFPANTEWAEVVKVVVQGKPKEEPIRMVLMGETIAPLPPLGTADGYHAVVHDSESGGYGDGAL